MIFCLEKSSNYSEFYAKLLQNISFGKESFGLQIFQFAGDAHIDVRLGEGTWVSQTTADSFLLYLFLVIQPFFF